MEEAESVGDSSRDVVGSVQSAAKRLLKSVLQCRAGAAAEQGGKEEQAMSSLQLLRKQEQLLLEYASSTADLELRNSLDVEPLQANDEEPSTEEELRKSIAKAREELAELRSRYLLDRSLLQSLQTGECLLNKLFPDDHSPTDKELGEGMDKQAELASKLLQESNDLEQLRASVASLQKERALSQQTCRALHSRLSQLRKGRETPPPQSGSSDDELQRARSEEALLRGVLRCVVAASGADWAEDDQLLAVITQTHNVR